MNNNVDLSVILPILNEDENIEKLVQELDEVLKKMKINYEILGINTPDKKGTFELLEKIGDKYKFFYPINMKYQSGKRKLQKGYQYQLGFLISKGKIIVHMDSDYEDDPRDIPSMVKKLNEGYDLVVGWRTYRKHTFFYRLSSKIYNFISNSITGNKLHDKNCGIKAYNAEAAKSLNLHGQNFRGIPLLLQAKGYRITEIPVNNRDRLGGKGHWNFSSRFLAGIFDLPTNVIISKTGDMPFRFWGLLSYLSLFAAIFTAFLYLYLIHTERLIKYTDFILILFTLFSIKSLLFFITGILMEFVLDNKEKSLSDYTILDDPKKRL